MKINHDYLKKLLIAFEDSTGHDTTLDEIRGAGFDPESSDFIFHMRLLGDYELITRADGGVGKDFYTIARIGNPGSRMAVRVRVPMRLTAKGHDFIADLRQKEVWNAITHNFKEVGITTLLISANSLLMVLQKRKLSS